ncbi:uncharacterized protein [Lolium perenne]|uniref:uncharacterized protein isoform X2 n=1 Tax=Lolium perenne TaxID=4522 RepID=UPI003A9A02C0
MGCSCDITVLISILASLGTFWHVSVMVQVKRTLCANTSVSSFATDVEKGFVKKSKAEKDPDKPKCPSSAFLVSVYFPHLCDISIFVLILWFSSCSNCCFGVFLVLPGRVQEGVKMIRLALLQALSGNLTNMLLALLQNMRFLLGTMPTFVDSTINWILTIAGAIVLVTSVLCQFPLLCVSTLDDPLCTTEAVPWDKWRTPNGSMMIVNTAVLVAQCAEGHVIVLT